MAAPVLLALVATLSGGPSQAVVVGASSPASALWSAEGEELEALQSRLAATARRRFQELSSAGSWSAREVDELLELLMVQSPRAASEPDFLERALPVATAALPDAASPRLVTELLARLTRSPGLPLGALEEIESAWGTIVRRSLERQVERPSWAEVTAGTVDSAIVLSIFSLGSALFDAAEVEPFLRALRRHAPERAVAILVDHVQAAALAPLAEELDLHLSRTWARSYSPWPRDSMSLMVTADGERLAVLRPNRQPTREDDSFMGLELIQDLPAAVYDRFGPIAWALSPIPFHNGNILRTRSRAWISIHSLESRILELLGLDRVPVESFGSAAGVGAYLAAARRAAGEMEQTFGDTTAFVHPLPEGTDPEALAAAMGLLGGGAGFDLDSVITVLDDPEGGRAALVGDPRAGARLVAGAAARELAAARAAYGLELEAPELRQALISAQASPTAAALGDFLDLVAEHLAGEGMTVRRLPLLWVPTRLLERAGSLPDDAFLIGWNNVVLESAGKRRDAEGFASGLESGDRLARQTFAELGYRLELLPPLIESVLRNGGYRCASNHLRVLD